MKILALGAHPDDIEIFMYGLVSIYKKEGNQVFTMIATDGAKGGCQTDELLIKKRAEETVAGLKNLSSPIFLNIPDGELGETPEHKKIIKGSSEDQIYKFLTKKYGEWILYDPQFNKNTYFLWFLPLFIFLFGGAIILKKLINIKK